MSDLSRLETTLAAIAHAGSWDERVASIRRIPEDFGVARHKEVYSRVAAQFYVPELAPDFAHVHWREEYELEYFQQAYQVAAASTVGFTRVTVDELERVFLEHPEALVVFRTLVGFTQTELAESTKDLPAELDLPSVGKGTVQSLEAGRPPQGRKARALAEVIVRLLQGEMFPADPASPMRRKQDKPDTARGWETVRRYAREGVPFDVYLHQRHYGGAFRQLLDATSSRRGDVLEDAVEDLLSEHEVPFIRTGRQNQEEPSRRFGLTVRPAPDFVFHDGGDQPRGFLECKATNDGGTARDKAGRFQALQAEGARLGGVPVFAVISGLGWKRTGDALGPVVQACDGRVFTPSTLDDLLAVRPLCDLARKRG